MLINNHTNANKDKIIRYLYLEDAFGLWKNFEKVSNNLGWHVTLKTNDLQVFIYTSMADDKYVTIKISYLFIPSFISSVETQLMFNVATQNN